MRAIDTLTPAALAEARDAGWQVAQLNLRGSNPEEGYRQAGLPAKGRVLVVIGYQGCSTHDFEALEKEAIRQQATLYVINGNTNEPGAERSGYNPQINVRSSTDGKLRPLNGVIVTPKNDNGKPMSPTQIIELANKIGMPVARGTNSTDPVSSITSGVKLFQDGRLVDYSIKAEMMPARTTGAFALG